MKSIHAHCTINWRTFKTHAGAKNLANREADYAASCTPSGSGGAGEGAWLAVVRNADGTYGVTWHNCSKADARRELCVGTVTLNGNRAVVGGFKNDFATVTDMTTGLSAEWSWSAVAVVITKSNGKFYS